MWIEHVSKTRGNSAGFDILSFEPDGSERMIEVKTTRYGKETPFFLSSNELAFSINNADRYHLYRVFDFRKTPQMFILPRSVKEHCLLTPREYIAHF